MRVLTLPSTYGSWYFSPLVGQPNKRRSNRLVNKLEVTWLVQYYPLHFSYPIAFRWTTRFMSRQLIQYTYFLNIKILNVMLMTWLREQCIRPILSAVHLRTHMIIYIYIYIHSCMKCATLWAKGAKILWLADFFLYPLLHKMRSKK